MMIRTRPEPAAVEDAKPAADQPAPGAEALDAIAADLGQIEGEGAPERPEAAPGMSTGDQLAGLLKGARLAVVPLARRRLPGTQFEEIWSEKQLDEIGAAWGLIFDINGWTLGGVMDKWGPYVMAAVATVPPAWATYELVQDAKAQAAAEARDRKAAPAQPPAAS